MGDLPWEWTEREGPGQVNLESFDKDWMGIACDLGLSLHVVVTMRNVPPWLSPLSGDDSYEKGICAELPPVKSEIPSTANGPPHVPPE